MYQYYDSDYFEDSNNTTYYFSLSLGDDIDCETCGYSNNEANLTISKIGFSFSYMIGCTGTDSVDNLDEQPLEKLAQMIEYLKSYPNWNIHYEDKVKNEIMEWLKQR